MNFFTNLKPIRDFLDFDQPSFYQQPPTDWFLVIADVQNSTQAIQQGHYKQVNMVGASTIAAITNCMAGDVFPFVFGGDGATALIPHSQKTAVEAALRAAQIMAKEHFDLHLRVGLVSVASLLEKQKQLSVARYELPGGPSLAFLRGDGFEEAEKIVKSGQNLLQEGLIQSLEEAMAGLSCRWAPLMSERGQMLSILIKATNQGEERGVLREVADAIHQIVDLSSPSTHPIKQEKLQSANLIAASRLEAQLQSGKSFWTVGKKVIFEMLIARFLLWTGWRVKSLDMRNYTKSIVAHSDFKKYDVVLRMVIDCSQEMVAKIRELLIEKNKNGLIYFGTQTSPSALMTCFVKSTDQGEHLHFIDGSNGGYALAALEMKQQMNSMKS